MFYAITGIMFLYVVLRLIIPLPLSGKARVLLGLFLLFVSQIHVFTRKFSGTMASPELPFPIMLAVGWMFAAFFLLFLLLVLRDLLLLGLRLLRATGIRVSLPGGPGRWAAGLAAAAMVLGSYGVWEAVRVPEVTTVEIGLPGLPPALDGTTLAVLTDMHASALLRGPRVRGVVEKTNALRPDLILILGDTVDGTPGKRRDDVAPLADLKARYGVYAVAGNHEYYSGFNKWMTTLSGLGLHMLENAHEVITLDGGRLVLAGITDPAAGRFALPGPNLHAALEGAPGGVPIILLAHQPRGARQHAAAGVALQLSGHTHGGQLYGVAPFSKRFNDFVSGLYDVDGMKLYVSNGSGLWNGFPIRIGVPAEITRILLRAE